MDMKKNLANIITISRLLGTIALAFTESLSWEFFLIYIWCGISDLLDGFIARKTKTVSALGSKLDSISDLSFFTTMMFKILKYLRKRFPAYMFVLIYLAVGLRILCYAAVGLRKGYFLSRHTLFNKLTGLLMFFLPFTVSNRYLIPYSLFILFVAFTAIFDEAIYIVRNWNDTDQTFRQA